MTKMVLQKTTKYCKSYIELSIWLLVFAVAIRFFEAILLYKNTHDFTSSIIWNLTGLCYDISLYLRLGIVLLILFIAGCFFSEKIARIILRILLSVMLLVSLSLILFFTTSGFLLDNVVFTYSLKEMWSIVTSSSKSPVWVYIVMVVLPVLFFYLSGKRIKINLFFAIFFAGLTISSFFIFSKLTPQTEQYKVKVNKEYFFLKSILKVSKEHDKDIIKSVTEFRRYFPELQFEEIEFPFLHKAQYKDVLSPFFNLHPEPPNIVFIIVEGLAYENLYNDILLMPFLDSLSKMGLSWEHCLSVSSRTFGVLPALLGAAPLGEKGFMYQSPNNPEFHSLPRILHQNKYTNHLFYGGWMSFDNMENFAETNHIKYFSESDWEEDIIKETIGSEWGYEDHLSYMQALRKLQKEKSHPRMDIYLSLTTHDPYEYPNRLHFQKMVNEKLLQNNILTAKQNEKYSKSCNLYGAFAYADWAIEQLFEGYKNRNDFDNTIFIITGDHSCFVSQYAGYSNYHVPLIIYSPMLKTARKMKGVVSHRDITPTLISLLKNNYNIETPKEVAWLNTALDTSLRFNANTFSPIQLIDHSIGGVLYKNYLFCEGILEEITDIGPITLNNSSVLPNINNLLSLYKSLDTYIFNNDALIKNYFAHKLNSAEIILNREDTISDKSYYAEKSELQVVEGPQGHKTTLFFDQSNSYPISFIKFEIPEGMEEFRVEIEFMIYVRNEKENDKCISIITDLHEVSYRSEYLTEQKQNRWYTYKKIATYKKNLLNQLGEQRYLNIYLWNNGELEGYIDDIKVKVTTNH